MPTQEVLGLQRRCRHNCPWQHGCSLEDGGMSSCHLAAVAIVVQWKKLLSGERLTILPANIMRGVLWITRVHRKNLRITHEQRTPSISCLKFVRLFIIRVLRILVSCNHQVIHIFQMEAGRTQWHNPNKYKSTYFVLVKWRPHNLKKYFPEDMHITSCSLASRDVHLHPRTHEKKSK